jgi:hypothetical protein
MRMIHRMHGYPYLVHPKLTALGEANLKGFRGRAVRPVARAVARRTDFSVQDVQALFGLAFFALSVYLLASTVRRALRSESSPSSI